MDNMGYPKLELGLSAMTKGQLADNLAYNSLKVCIFIFVFIDPLLGSVCGNTHNYYLCVFICQGLILSKALKAQKDAEDESTRIAFGNLTKSYFL
jgi:hypothetical protein